MIVSRLLVKLPDGVCTMKRARLRVRTLLIGVAILAVLLEIGGLGRQSRRYATKAREAAEAERINQNVARNSKLYASQCLEQAARIAATDPAKAADLRAKAERTIESIPSFEGQARRAAKARIAFERAMTHPWEGQPPDVPRLNSTPPVEEP